MAHYWVYPSRHDAKEIIFVCASEAEKEHARINFPNIPQTFYPYHKAVCDIADCISFKEPESAPVYTVRYRPKRKLHCHFCDTTRLAKPYADWDWVCPTCSCILRVGW